MITSCALCDLAKKDKKIQKRIPDEQLLEMTCTCDPENSCLDTMCAWFVAQPITLRLV